MLSTSIFHICQYQGLSNLLVSTEISRPEWFAAWRQPSISPNVGAHVRLHRDVRWPRAYRVVSCQRRSGLSHGALRFLQRRTLCAGRHGIAASDPTNAVIRVPASRLQLFQEVALHSWPTSLGAGKEGEGRR